MTTPSRLTDDLHSVLAHAGGKPLPLFALVDLLGERGHALVMIVLAFPFLQPVPTMGLSAPAGFAVAAMGLCILLGRRPSLPSYLALREIHHTTLEGMVRRSVRVVARLERCMRPRMQFMLWPGFRALMGVNLIFAGLALSAPIPVPFSNAIPAAAIVLYCLGTLERDGALILAGHALCASLLVLAVVLWDVVGAALLPILRLVLG